MNLMERMRTNIGVNMVESKDWKKFPKSLHDDMSGLQIQGNIFQSRNSKWVGMGRIRGGEAGEGGGEEEGEEGEEVGRRGDLHLLLQIQTVLFRCENITTTSG